MGDSVTVVAIMCDWSTYMEGGGGSGYVDGSYNIVTVMMMDWR